MYGNYRKLRVTMVTPYMFRSTKYFQMLWMHFNVPKKEVCMKFQDIVNAFISDIVRNDVSFSYSGSDMLVARYQSGYDLYDIDPDSLERVIKSVNAAFSDSGQIVICFNSFGELTPILQINYILSDEEKSDKTLLEQSIKNLSSKAYSILGKIRKFEKIDSRWNGEY